MRLGLSGNNNSDSDEGCCDEYGNPIEGNNSTYVY